MGDMVQNTGEEWMALPDQPRKRTLINDEVSVLAVGVSASQDNSGVELGSAALLGSGLLEQLQETRPDAKVFYDHTIHTYREAQDPELIEESENWSSSNSTLYPSGISNARHAFQLSYANERISQQVFWQARKGRAALTLGGDHSVSIGTVTGVTKACREWSDRSPALIWADAHARLHTPESSPNGYIDGMTVSFLSGLIRTADGEPFSWLDDTADGGASNLLDLSKLVYIGLRDTDPTARHLIKKHQMKAFTMSDIHRMGIEQVMVEAISYIGDDTPIHLSFNLSAVDPRFAPSVTNPVADGLTLGESEHICRSVSRNLVAMDLVELNPLAVPDDEGRSAYETVKTAITVIQKAFGAQ